MTPGGSNRRHIYNKQYTQYIGTYREDRQTDMIGVVGVYVGLFIEKSCYKNRVYCTLMFIDDKMIKLIPTQTSPKRNSYYTYSILSTNLISITSVFSVILYIVNIVCGS